MEHKPVRNIAKKSGWETTLDKKLAAKDRKRFFGRLFCVMHAQGKWQEWTPYKRPLSMAETSRRLRDEM